MSPTTKKAGESAAQSSPGKSTLNQRGIRPQSTELVSVDDTIDSIAREALEEARRVEEAERYRHNPGPVVPPHKTIIAP